MTPLHPNPVVHLELTHRRPAGASAPYSDLCGWRPEPVETCAGRHLAFEFGAALAAGMVQTDAGRPVSMPDVQVDGTHEATDRARRLGAAVAVGPREGPVPAQATIQDHEHYSQPIADDFTACGFSLHVEGI
jgi:predicted enzyme related to lactoylglutathione lyase